LLFYSKLKNLSSLQPIIGEYVLGVDVIYTCIEPEIIISLEFKLESSIEHVYYLSVLDLLIEFLRDTFNSITEPVGLGDFYFNSDSVIIISGYGVYVVDDLVSKYFLSTCTLNTLLVTQNKETCLVEVTPQSINCGVKLDASGSPTSFNVSSISKRIVGGTEATAHSYPWQVSIQRSSLPS
jgi:hypothetical protein